MVLTACLVFVCFRKDGFSSISEAVGVDVKSDT